MRHNIVHTIQFVDIYIQYRGIENTSSIAGQNISIIYTKPIESFHMRNDGKF